MISGVSSPPHTGANSQPKDSHAAKLGHPILLDLNGNGIEITALGKSTRFVVDENGLKHRTAWAGVGDGVLFVDVDGNGEISNAHEYVFTEWDASADDDMEALRAAFDTNGDGKLTNADARFGLFRVLVTNADGSTTAQTLAALGITEIDLRPDTTFIELPDGSVITGQTTFVMGGTTRTSANVSLMAEVQGATVTDAISGTTTRTVVSTGRGETGDTLFIVKSETTQSQGLVVNYWDMDGDSVFERVQRITTTVNGTTGARTEVVENWHGSSIATGVKDSRTVTVTSADGKQVTIERDADWAGWFAERETRTTGGNGNRTVLIETLAPDGSVISVTKSGITPNGSTRTFHENLDGIGGSGSSGAERTTEVAISTDTQGVRTEATTVAGKAGVFASETLTVSANGLVRTTLSDLNADGVIDTRVTDTTTQVSGGGTSTVVEVRNHDNSLRAKVASTVSADGLVTTRSEDIDGNGSWDRSTTETVAIDGAGVRTTTVHVKNTDSSTNSLTKTVLGADKVAREEWSDLNGDGVFSAAEKVLQVTVEAGTNDRLTTAWEKSLNGTVLAVSTERTTANGLSSTRTLDADSDGDLDRHETDVTVVTGGAATRTVTVKTGDQTDVISKTETTVSADGLTVTVKRDTGGTNNWESQTVESRSTGGDGSITQTVTGKSGNGTVLSSQATVTSADRRTVTVTTDVDGRNTAVDLKIESVLGTDGSRTVTEEHFTPGTVLTARTVTVTSANGLTRTVTEDINGDASSDRIQSAITTFETDGSVQTDALVRNGDQSLRGATRTVTSDDGLTVTVFADRDGDIDGNGVVDFDHRQKTETILGTDGSRTTNAEDWTYSDANPTGVRLSQVQVTVSDDGLVTTERMNSDGDKNGSGSDDFDLTRTTTVSTQANGTRLTIVHLQDQAGVTRNRTETSVSDDGHTVTINEFLNADAAVDRVTNRLVANDGTVTETVTDMAYAALASKTITVTSANGLSVAETVDADGDGTVDRTRAMVTTLRADGGRDIVVEDRATAGTVLSRTATTVSADGWVTTTTRDLDPTAETGSVVDFTEEVSRSLSAAGVEIVLTKLYDQNLGTIRIDKVQTSADRREVVTEVNLNGGTVVERTTTVTLADDGSRVTRVVDRAATGVTAAERETTVSADGLTTTGWTDADGDGSRERVFTATTTPGPDGSVETTRNWRSDHHITLAETREWRSDDGLSRTVAFDLGPVEIQRELMRAATA